MRPTSDSECCPICRAAVPLNWAVEWDNGEPAPNTNAEGYMSVCVTCHKGVYGQIKPWEWVTASIRWERHNAKEVRGLLERLEGELADIKARV